MGTQLLCEKCGAANLLEAIYCKGCGYNLRDILRSDELTAFISEATKASLNLMNQRKAYFARSARLILRYNDETDLVPDLSQNTFTLGRKAPENPPYPHLDLSSYQASEKGVSRVHARITRMNAILVLEDLAALNGTFVNGERISAVKPIVLCNSDEIRLGKLRLNVNYATD